jgi:hypothetical protein
VKATRAVQTPDKVKLLVNSGAKPNSYTIHINEIVEVTNELGIEQAGEIFF